MHIQPWACCSTPLCTLHVQAGKTPKDKALSNDKHAVAGLLNTCAHELHHAPAACLTANMHGNIGSCAAPRINAVMGRMALNWEFFQVTGKPSSACMHACMHTPSDLQAICMCGSSSSSSAALRFISYGHVRHPCSQHVCLMAFLPPLEDPCNCTVLMLPNQDRDAHNPCTAPSESASCTGVLLSCWSNMQYPHACMLVWQCGVSILQ